MQMGGKLTITTEDKLESGPQPGQIQQRYQIKRWLKNPFLVFFFFYKITFSICPHLWNSLQWFRLIISPGVDSPCQVESLRKPCFKTWYKLHLSWKNSSQENNKWFTFQLVEWTHVRWETLIRWRTTSNIETPEQSRSLQQKNENGIPRRCSISILGEQVCLSCDRGLFRRPHTLDIGDKLQRRVSRLKSLLSHL